MYVNNLIVYGFQVFTIVGADYVFLIDGREILPDIFHNEDIAKGVLISGTHVEPKSVYALNEITFLVTYSSEY